MGECTSLACGKSVSTVRYCIAPIDCMTAAQSLHVLEQVRIKFLQLQALCCRLLVKSIIDAPTHPFRPSIHLQYLILKEERYDFQRAEAC